jgi:hypothetical protein
VRKSDEHCGRFPALGKLLRDSSLCFRHEELDHLARERDLMLTAVKGAHMEQLQTLKSRVLELQAQCKTLEGQVHKAECTQATAAKEKDAVISK